MGNELSSSLPEDWATVDMLNRFTFCPRLFHLMYVEGRWEENSHTLEGKAIHRRVDRIDELLPVAAAPEEDRRYGLQAHDPLASCVIPDVFPV